jgi:hypothetical protein
MTHLDLEPEVAPVPEFPFSEEPVAVNSRFRIEASSGVHYVVLLSDPLALGHLIRERVGAGRLVDGSWRTNAPGGFRTPPRRIGEWILLEAPGATLLSYQLDPSDIDPYAIDGEILIAGTSERYDVVRPDSRTRLPRPMELDQEAPKLTVATPARAIAVDREVNSIEVAGSVADRSGIRSIEVRHLATDRTVDAETNRNPGDALMHRQVRYRAELPLELGVNRLEVIAVDGVGNRIRLEIEVRRG